MAEKTRAQLKVDRDNLIKVGAAGSIQPAADNAQRKNEADSAVNILDDRSMLNLQEHSSTRSKPYNIGECFMYNGQLRQAILEHIGAYDAAYSQAITPQVITGIVPAYTLGESVTIGAIRSFNGSLIRKINNSGPGHDPYDTYEWVIFSPLLPYYGVLYVASQVYVTNMVVRKQIGSDWMLYRKVKPSGGSPEYIYSTDFAAELLAGEWQVEITLPTFVPVIPPVTSAEATLIIDNNSQHLNNYTKASGQCDVTLGDVDSGLKVYFYVRGGTFKFLCDGTLHSLSDNYNTMYVECCAVSLGGGNWLITETNP